MQVLRDLVLFGVDLVLFGVRSCFLCGSSLLLIKQCGSCPSPVRQGRLSSVDYTVLYA